MKEILGNNLKQFFDIIDPNYNEAEIEFKNNEYEVWYVTDKLYEQMCNMTEDGFVKLAGEEAWWRSCKGSNQDGRKLKVFLVNNKPFTGWRNKYYQDDFENHEEENQSEYTCLTEYLSCHMGCSLPKNVIALCMDLARYNQMSVGELFSKYEGLGGKDGHEN